MSCTMSKITASATILIMVIFQLLIGQFRATDAVNSMVDDENDTASLERINPIKEVTSIIKGLKFRAELSKKSKRSLADSSGKSSGGFEATRLVKRWKRQPRRYQKTLLDVWNENDKNESQPVERFDEINDDDDVDNHFTSLADMWAELDRQKLAKTGIEFPVPAPLVKEYTFEEVKVEEPKTNIYEQGKGLDAIWPKDTQNFKEYGNFISTTDNYKLKEITDPTNGFNRNTEIYYEAERLRNNIDKQRKSWDEFSKEEKILNIKKPMMSTTDNYRPKEFSSPRDILNGNPEKFD